MPGLQLPRAVALPSEGQHRRPCRIPGGLWLLGLPIHQQLLQQSGNPLQPLAEGLFYQQQPIGMLLADPIAWLHGGAIGVGSAAPAVRPGLSAGFGVGLGAQLAALELLH